LLLLNIILSWDMGMFREKLFGPMSIILSRITATYNKLLPSTTPFKYSSPLCAQVFFSIDDVVLVATHGYYASIRNMHIKGTQQIYITINVILWTNLQIYMNSNSTY
jgi:hypothetical protein